MNNSFSEHNKLAEAKQIRKRADEDAKLLANRIALLKQEEIKARLKIEETKKKAQEILYLRSKHSELLKIKIDQKRQRDQSELQRQEENKKLRELKQFRSQQLFSGRKNRAFSEANRMKESRKNNLFFIHNSKQEDLQHRASLRNFIKNQLKEAEEKRKKVEREKIEKARNEMLNRLEEENRLRKLKEEEIIRMEQEEMELIHKLQKTQLRQKEVYQELENALSGSIAYNP